MNKNWVYKQRRIRSDEESMLETSARAFQTFYGGKIPIIDASVDKPTRTVMATPRGWFNVNSPRFKTFLSH